MRLSVLAGAVLFASGSFVFSRPLTAQQETGDLSLSSYVSLPSYNIASALSDSNPNSLSSDTPETTTNVDPVNSVTPGTSPALQGINLPTYSGTSFRTSFAQPDITSANTYTNYLSASPGAVNQPIQNLSPPSNNVPSVENAPTLPDAVKKSFVDFANGYTYCMYELVWQITGPSANQPYLVRARCDKTENWSSFRHDFDDVRPGVALFLPGYGQVFSILNHVHGACQQKDPGNLLLWGSNRESPCLVGESTVLSLKPAWEELVRGAFPALTLVSSNVITTIQELEQFGASSHLSDLPTPSGSEGEQFYWKMRLDQERVDDQPSTDPY